MRPTKSPLNQGIRWPYLNQPYPALKTEGRLLTNQLTSITSEASTVLVRGEYHREWSYHNYLRFVPQPWIAHSAASPLTRLILREREVNCEFHSSQTLGDPQLNGFPRGPCFMPGYTFGVVSSNNPRRHKREVDLRFLVPLVSMLLPTWRSYVVTWTFSPEAARLRGRPPRW